MPKIRCFCVFEYAGTDMKEMDKNREKNDKYEHEIWNE